MSLVNCKACGEIHDADCTCARPQLAGAPGSATRRDFEDAFRSAGADIGRRVGMQIVDDLESILLGGVVSNQSPNATGSAAREDAR